MKWEIVRKKNVIFIKIKKRGSLPKQKTINKKTTKKQNNALKNKIKKQEK